jgi:hypothetical protein
MINITLLNALGKFVSRRFVNNPIFVVGGSRSGTSVLRKALGQHPLILSTPSESPFFTDLGGIAYDLTQASERELLYYADSLHISRDYLFETFRRLGLESSLGPYYGLYYLLKIGVREKRNITNKRHFCVKCTPGQRVVQGLHALYPSARFIWIVRSGVSVVYSRTKYPDFKDLEFSEHCHHWANSIHRFAYLSHIPEAIMVRHEELVEDPDREFSRIFRFVDVPYHSAPTEYAQHTLVHPLADETITGINVKEVLKQRPLPYEMWDEQQKAIFKEICSNSMELAGYKMPY